jgi:glycosyltransferase involved in cell wall biosynthesis
MRTVKRWPKAVYLRIVERRIISDSKGIIYTTDEEKRLATRQAPRLTKEFVVPLGGDAPPSDCRAALKKSFLSRYQTAVGRQQLLFLGRLDEKKGLEKILAALPGVLLHVPNVLLTIVGRGSRQYERALASMVQSLGLQNCVLFTGWLGGAEKWAAYATAEVFLLPSRQENFAITVAEAMQSGLPVIISDNVNSWPYVSDAEAGVVLRGEWSVSSLEQSIVRLLKSKSLRDEMAARGEHLARARLTWAQSARHLLNCYEDCVRFERPRLIEAQ